MISTVYRCFLFEWTLPEWGNCCSTPWNLIRDSSRSSFPVSSSFSLSFCILYFAIIFQLFLLHWTLWSRQVLIFTFFTSCTLNGIFRNFKCVHIFLFDSQESVCISRHQEFFKTKTPKYSQIQTFACQLHKKK